MPEENIPEATEIKETVSPEENGSGEAIVSKESEDKIKAFLLPFWNDIRKILSRPDRRDIVLSPKEVLGFSVLYFVILFLYLQATPRSLFSGQVKITIGMGVPALFALAILTVQIGMYVILALIKERKYASPSQAIVAMLPMYLLLLSAILIGSFSFIASAFLSAFALTSYLTNLSRLTARSSYYGELASRILMGMILGGIIVFALVFLIKKATLSDLGIDINTFNRLLQ